MFIDSWTSTKSDHKLNKKGALCKVHTCIHPQVTNLKNYAHNKKYISSRELVMITLLPRWYSGNVFLWRQRHKATDLIGVFSVHLESYAL